VVRLKRWAVARGVRPGQCCPAGSWVVKDRHLPMTRSSPSSGFSGGRSKTTAVAAHCAPKSDPGEAGTAGASPHTLAADYNQTRLRCLGYNAPDSWDTTPARSRPRGSSRSKACLVSDIEPLHRRHEPGPGSDPAKTRGSESRWVITAEPSEREPMGEVLSLAYDSRTARLPKLLSKRR
jgi:hypothetical protein